MTAFRSIILVLQPVKNALKSVQYVIYTCTMYSLFLQTLVRTNYKLYEAKPMTHVLFVRIKTTTYGWKRTL